MNSLIDILNKSVRYYESEYKLIFYYYIDSKTEIKENSEDT